MSSVRVDHILTFADVSSVDDYVDEYRARGFIVEDETRPYKPGLRNRFISTGCEYVELAWVEHEAEFAAGGTEEFARMFPNLPDLRRAVRPFSVAFQTASVEDLHQAWTARGFEVPPVWSFAPPGMPPILSFQVIPNSVLPGVSAFAITYHGAPDNQTRQIQAAPNSVYALEGITLVSATPQANASRWRDLLAPEGAVEQEDGVYGFTLGAHRLGWMTAEQYRGHYDLEWVEAPHQQGEIAALHLLAADLGKVESLLGARAHYQQAAHTGQRLLVARPGGRDGLTFIIREYPIEAWRDERGAITGERLIVKSAP